MQEKLNRIRKPEKPAFSPRIVSSCLLLAAGLALGLLSKLLDETPGNLLPPILQQLDLGNFFSRMGFWLFAGIAISVKAKTPLQAALNTFLFFAGMVSTYYLYTVFIAGFFPRSYMMIWIGLTLLSPLLAAVCWYAGGTHPVSIAISCLLFTLMTRQAFSAGLWYLDVRYFLEVLLWLGTLWILYQTPRQTITVACVGTVLFLLTAAVNLPFGLF